MRSLQPCETARHLSGRVSSRQVWWRILGIFSFGCGAVPVLFKSGSYWIANTSGSVRKAAGWMARYHETAERTPSAPRRKRARRVRRTKSVRRDMGGRDRRGVVQAVVYGQTRVLLYSRPRSTPRALREVGRRTRLDGHSWLPPTTHGLSRLRGPRNRGVIEDLRNLSPHRQSAPAAVGIGIVSLPQSVAESVVYQPACRMTSARHSCGPTSDNHSHFWSNARPFSNVPSGNRFSRATVVELTAHRG